jgi:hypothetical protein
MTEADLLRDVRELARWRGWYGYHTYRSTRSDPGFPDLVLVRPPRLIFAELKTAKGQMSGPQKVWREELEQLGAPVEYHVWRPADWMSGRIDDALR